jgi:hypothetical protein
MQLRQMTNSMTTVCSLHISQLQARNVSVDIHPRSGGDSAKTTPKEQSFLWSHTKPHVAAELGREQGLMMTAKMVVDLSVKEERNGHL